MKRPLLRYVCCVLLALGLIACSDAVDLGGPDAPGGSDAPNPAPPAFDDPNDGQPVVTPDGLEPTLLKSYYVLETQEHDGVTESVPTYRYITYRPLNRYGWDRLELQDNWFAEGSEDRDGVDYNRSDWLHLTFNRAATVVVLWKGEELASWLSDWEEVPAIENNSRSFEKVFQADETAVLGRGEAKGHYDLLIGEGDGSKPKVPPLPEDISEDQRPIPNELCPAWVHDRYIVTNPVDERRYRTWHPAIDPVYWCYFGHEHGSDPALVGYTPYFGYTAYKNYNQDERHEGFKGFAFRDGDVNWYVNVHATTGLHTRVCTQTHTVVMAALDDDGRLLAELSFKGDFGEARANTGDNALITNRGCPQAAIEQAGTRAEKSVRVIGAGYQDEDYERWRFVGHKFLGLTMAKDWHHLTVDIRNPLTACDGLRCESFKLTNPEAEHPWDNRGDVRTLNFQGTMTLEYSQSRDLSDGKEDGYFYTDAKGTTHLNPDDPNAVRQFVSKTLVLNQDEEFDIFGISDPWRGMYQAGKRHALPGFKLESSKGDMN